MILIYKGFGLMNISNNIYFLIYRLIDEMLGWTGGLGMS